MPVGQYPAPLVIQMTTRPYSCWDVDSSVRFCDTKNVTSQGPYLQQTSCANPGGVAVLRRALLGLDFYPLHDVIKAVARNQLMLIAENPD